MLKTLVFLSYLFSISASIALALLDLKYCKLTQMGTEYLGRLSNTKSNLSCQYWSLAKQKGAEFLVNEAFPEGSKILAKNYCRNPNKNPNGPWCYTNQNLIQDFCDVPFCEVSGIKLNDTANGHIGKHNDTRLKRNWKSRALCSNDAIAVKNFPDFPVKGTENFCRNTSKIITQPWSFLKVRVPRDLSITRNCEKPLECTALTSGYVRGTFIYILPKWRENGFQLWLKAWNPDIYEGLVLSLFSKNHSQEYTLFIGDEDNEKVKLFFKNESSGNYAKFFSEIFTEVSLLQKTLPHLIPTGKWKGFWLRPGFGKIELGYHGVPTSFFDWTSSNENIAFEPMFLNFGTIKNHLMGISFNCDECLTIQTSTEEGLKIFPINLWRDETITSSLRLNLRGTGSAFITLMWTQDFKKLFGIQIMSNETNVIIVQYTDDIPRALAVFSVSSTISENRWSEYIISFTEDTLTLYKDGSHLFEWKSSFPLLFHWFTVTAESGVIIWTANCPAPDIEGEPRDGNWGKWGPWSCSVTCGKGHGRIQRICNDPPPNVFGHECKGMPVYEGPCNDFPCGRISADTYNIIRYYLSSQQKSLQVDVSERVVLACNPHAISLIMKEVSEMNITWTHNGFPYSRTKFHMDENYSLVIHRAQEKHNGIYLCLAYQDPDSIPSKIVLEVISLIVIKPKPKKIREGKSLTLKCNGLALSYVYADLSQRWELNGTVWKDYGLGTLETFTVDKLQNVSDSHSGIWTCVILQEDFRFKWTTNWIYLKVKSAPSFWSHLMENIATTPLFKKLSDERNALFLCFALIVTMACCLVLIMCLCINCLNKCLSHKNKN